MVFDVQIKVSCLLYKRVFTTESKKRVESRFIVNWSLEKILDFKWVTNGVCLWACQRVVVNSITYVCHIKCLMLNISFQFSL